MSQHTYELQRRLLLLQLELLKGLVHAKVEESRREKIRKSNY